MKSFSPKLVRDKIPAIILAKGRSCEHHVADDEELRERLREKLREEVEEFIAAENVEELADVREVLDAYAAMLGISKDDSDGAQAKKREERGGFAGKVVLDAW